MSDGQSLSSSDRSRLERLIGQAADRLAGLQAVTEALSQSLTPEQVAGVVVEQGVGALGARAGSLALLSDDGSELRLIRTVGYPEDMVEPYRAFRLDAPLPLSEVTRTGQPVYLERWEQWLSHYSDSAENSAPPRTDEAWAAIPLVVEGRAIGGIGLTFAGERAFSDDEKSFMQALARQCAQSLERVRLYQESERARAAAEDAERRMAFLAEAGAALAASLDYETTLARLAGLIVPSLADWCAVDVFRTDGSLARLAVAHVDPAKMEWSREIQRRYPSDPEAATGIYQVLRTGKAEFYPDIPDELLVKTARDPGHLEILRQVGLRSVMIVPLSARGRTLGALTFVGTDESGRRFGPADLAFAEDLAFRAALAVDNARLYHEARLSERHKDETLAQWEAMLTGSPAGFAFIDTDRRFVRVNETLARLNGLPASAHIGRFVWEILGELQWRYRRPFFERAFSGEAVLDVDLSADLPQHARGGRHILVSYYPVRLAGQVVGVGAVTTDVTERDRAEAALRESEQRFRQVADSAPVLLWMAGEDALCHYFNKPWMDFTGRTMEQERGSGWLEGVHPDDLDRCRALYGKSFQARESFEVEYRLRRSDGEYRWLLGIGSPRFQPDGEFLGYIGSCIDVTTRKEAEAALLENESRQRAFLREMLSSVTEGKLRLCDTPADLPPRLASLGDSVSLTRSMLGAIRHAAREAALAQGLSEARTQDLETAVGETAMNAVVHAGGGIGEVRVGEGRVQVWVTDSGTGIDVQRLPRATLERGFTTAGTLGHGFWMVLHTADTVWLLTGLAGTTVVIEQHREALEPAWLTQEPPPL